MANTIPPVPPLSPQGFSDPAWQRWFNSLRSQLMSVATSVLVQTANGFEGTVAINLSGVAVITLGTPLTGLVKGNGSQLIPAVSGTDYLAGLTITGAATGTNTGNSLALTLANSGAVAGTYNNVTINAKGIATAGTNIGYITGNQTITLSGDVSGSGATAITVTLPVTGVAAGTYNSLTVNAKGLVTAATTIAYLTANQSITLSGDVTGSGTTAIAATLAASGVTAATYGSATSIPQIVVDAKGRITSATSVAITVGLAGYGPTSSRPASPGAGSYYFDTTLGFPVWVASLGPVVWVNAAGVVS